MRKLLTLAAGIGIAGVLALGSQSAALATTYGQQCDQGGTGFCLNAWNQGPLVKAYTPGVLNDAFGLEQINGNTWSIVAKSPCCNGLLVGDYNNDSGSAKAGLDFSGSWGTAFTAYNDSTTCPNGGTAFKNNHWGGWLEATDSDGSQFYLNTGTPECFVGSTFNA